jgi:hypothetical protein
MAGYVSLIRFFCGRKQRDVVDLVDADELGGDPFRPRKRGSAPRQKKTPGVSPALVTFSAELATPKPGEGGR